MDKFMVLIPSSIVSGALIGLAMYNNIINEDQALLTCVFIATAMLYITRKME